MRPGGTGELAAIANPTCDLIFDARWRVIIQGEVFADDAGGFRFESPADGQDFPVQTFELSSTTLAP